MYTRYTKQFYIWTPLVIINYVSAGLYILLFLKKLDLHDVKNEGFGITNPPMKETMFMQAMINDMDTKIVNITILLALVTASTWLRVVVALQATETFGPIITAIGMMVLDILQMLFIYMLQLIAFSILAAMAFFRVEIYEGI